MPLGTEHPRSQVAQGDTAELTAYIYSSNDLPLPAADIAGVTFTIKVPKSHADPDGTITAAGTVQADGSGFYRFEDTSAEGLYVWTCQFTLDSGEKKTYRDEFQVVNLLSTAPQETRNDEIANAVWLKLEDCFDSEEGGPWLRDMTESWFGPDKIPKLVAQGLLLVNIWPPATDLGLDYFTTKVIDPDPSLPAGSLMIDPDQYIIVQATLVATIKHLMRSYVEQPDVRGTNMNYQDRRDYLQRWGTILEIEERAFKESVALWKRQFYNFGKGALLVHSKAGRVFPVPGWRTRNAARGW